MNHTGLLSQLNQQKNWSELHPDEEPIELPPIEESDGEPVVVHSAYSNSPTLFAEILRNKLLTGK